jgi:nuclear pore complex protein Nup43
LTAHNSSICEIAFHRTEPTKLYTASENGELWQWAQNTMPTIISGMEYDLQTESGNINPWLNSERAKNKINVNALELSVEI